MNWERRGEALRESDIPLPNAGLHTIEIAYIGDRLELFVEVLTDVDSAVWRAVAAVEAVGR